MKNRTAVIRITNMEFPNIGTGYFEGKKVFVKNTIAGQLAEVLISRKKNALHGQKLSILEKSPIETEPKCVDFDFCGGCTYQNISYADELRIKEKMVLDLLAAAGIEGYEYLGIEPAPYEEAYRNKMEYSFGDEGKNGALALGMRKRQSNYEVVTSQNCNIVDEDYRKILAVVLRFFQNSEESFYNIVSHKGTLRNLVVRKAFFTGEILINLVTTGGIAADLNKLAAELKELPLDGKIAGILHTVNTSISDAVKCETMTILYGQDYLTEHLLGLKFKISVFSFFQTNSAGAERLYTTVREFAGDTKDKTVFDLYCGTGTIAQIIAENARKVIGIELIPEAVTAARENAEQNGIQNCAFIAGDVLEAVDSLSDAPDIIILDPPREGIHPKAIGKIISFGAKEIVYISCKASSLCKDLAAFTENGYQVKKIKLHDMFPRTYHVECVVLMSRKE